MSIEQSAAAAATQAPARDWFRSADVYRTTAHEGSTA